MRMHSTTIKKFMAWHLSNVVSRYLKTINYNSILKGKVTHIRKLTKITGFNWHAHAVRLVVFKYIFCFYVIYSAGCLLCLSVSRWDKKFLELYHSSKKLNKKQNFRAEIELAHWMLASCLYHSHALHKFSYYF